MSLSDLLQFPGRTRDSGVSVARYDRILAAYGIYSKTFCAGSLAWKVRILQREVFSSHRILIRTSRAIRHQTFGMACVEILTES